jgi:hypothetical protein
MDSEAFDRAMAERWHLYKPPARPSAGEVEIYRSFMREPRRTLLLGSTPEIRSLAQRYGHRLTVVDKDAAVYRALAQLTSPAGEATFIEADWLEMTLDARFELAIGDGAINMIPPSTHARFLERVATYLEPGGTLLLRAYILDEPRFSTPEQVFERFRDGGADIYTATKIHLSHLWIDRATRAMSNVVFWRNLRELHRQGVITDDEIRALGRILEDDALSVYFVARDQLEAQAAPYFTLEEVRSGGDYEASELKPIFCFRRK